MTKVQITKKMFARGSFGIAPINQRNGRPKPGTEHVINVWTVFVDGQTTGHFATRDEARIAASRASDR